MVELPKYSRILVARAARRLPAVIDALRSRRVHLTGLRLLVPHLTSENCEEVLARAAGKSKRDVEELVARLAPQPPVAAVVRKVAAAPIATPALPSAMKTPVNTGVPWASAVIEVTPDIACAIASVPGKAASGPVWPKAETEHMIRREWLALKFA